MKKILLGILFIVLIVVSYLTYNELSFSPLKNKDFTKLFKQSENFTKSCSKNLLSISSKGELFEIYRYNTKNAVIDKDYPRITEWENKFLTSEATFSKWKQCPLDYKTMDLYKFTLTSNNFDNISCFHSFNKEISNPQNYYCFIHINDLEQYFFLYCSDKKELYYIRRKGF